MISLVAAICAGMWAVGKLIVWQFNNSLDIRFKALEDARMEGRKAHEERFQRLEEKHDRLDQDVRKILQELPREYVRREDQVRNQTVIEAKIDALALRFENTQLRSRS